MELLIAAEKRSCIAGAVQNAHNNDFGVGIAVIKSVVPEKGDAQAGGQVITGRDELGMGKEGLEAFAETRLPPWDCRRR